MAIEARVPTKDRPMPSTAERLRELIAKRAKGADAEQVALFAHLLLQRGAGYIDELPEEDAAALVDSAFRWYAAPGPEVRVRALTPTYASEGWDAPVSVVETVMADRPFIVDTIRSRLAARGVEVQAFLHPMFSCERDVTGRLEGLWMPEASRTRESFAHIAIDRTTDAAALARLADDMHAALEDVRLVTDDFPAMVARAQAVATHLGEVRRARSGATGEEAVAVADLLRWLVDGAFVFLGYRTYVVSSLYGQPVLTLESGSGLGLLRREERSAFVRPRQIDQLPPWVRTRLFGPRIITVAKTLARSPVHRDVHMDDIGVKELDADGQVVEHRFLGLFTSKAHAEEAADIPLLRRTLKHVLTAEKAVPGSHDYRELVAIFNALPKAELFASSPADVHADVRTVQAAARTDDVVVSVRAQRDAGRVSVLVVMPRERYSGEAGAAIREVLGPRIGGTLLDEHQALGEFGRAVLHFVYAAEPAVAIAEDEVRAVVAALVRTWEERLAAVLEATGADGERLAERWRHAFPETYQARIPAERAAKDVLVLEQVLREGNPRIVLGNDDGSPEATALRLFLAGAPLVLSEFMPVIENLGLRALTEEQVPVTPAGGGRLTIQTFFVQDRAGRRLDPQAIGSRLADALLAVHAGRVTNDALNRLVLEGGLDWRAVDCLRTYGAYGVQIGLAARAVAIVALAEHAATARLLFECFAARFRPESSSDDAATLRQRLLASLDQVQSLREDLLLRALLDVVEATVRTNYFARAPEVEYIAIKIRSVDLAHLPVPRPLYEIFVHAPAMEGVHLRGGKVARGGLRHSDRPEDFRTEVLGLMRTQTVKNALIVPTGAKGGFVVKTTGAARPAPPAVLAAYETFIRGLLDLTDNLVGGRAVHPRGLVIYDEEDPYLVVAADKGTASFSDVANGLAAEYDFWLGDAFASGGSHGYDHKRLGITARGAWESVRTHFRERGVDADTAPLTVVGIGDMGGDVFGNGLLRSPHLLLQAAFNHVHVFLDPTPDPARSFAERARLFKTGLGWDAYDPTVLSPGGMVVPRAAKRVTLTPEVRSLLRVDDESLSGERLVRAVLMHDADLFWSGGIGTYVAAPEESDAEVRDVLNDPVRIKANAFRARVVAEGGNLGFTQRARIVIALGGRSIDTDAVDNSAGVDMSDHEVNLKIALKTATDAGQLTFEARNRMLAEVTDEVATRVLGHNRLQSRLLGYDQVRSRTRLADFLDLIAELERSAGLDRMLACLPDRATLRARRGVFLGLTRPELAMVMAYTKIYLQRELLTSSAPEDPLVEPYLLGYFPSLIVARHPDAVRRHTLRREIVTTEVVNTLVDELGATFVHRLTRDTGSRVPEAVRAWTIAWSIVGGAAIVAAVAEGAPSAEVETSTRLVLERTCERVTKWLLANTDPSRPASELAAELCCAIGRVRSRLPEWITGAEAEAFHKLRSELEMAGLQAPLARDLASADWLTGALDVVTVARQLAVDPEDAAACYYALGQQIDFAWLWTRLAEAADEDRWQRRAVEGLVDDLLRARRQLTGRALERHGELPVRPLGALADLIRDLRAAPRTSLAALEVVVREVRRLAESVVEGKT
jgi:glutamate dehydrogenase